MDAYVEHIRGGLVRVGASKAPEPYQYSVTYDDRGPYAVIKGFWHKRISRTEFETIIRTINQASGKLVAYERAGFPSIQIRQVDPTLTKGRIVMHKHHVNEAINADGSINQVLAVQCTLDACVEILAGRLKLISMEQTGVADHPARIKFSFEAETI